MAYGLNYSLKLSVVIYTGISQGPTPPAPSVLRRVLRRRRGGALRAHEVAVRLHHIRQFIRHAASPDAAREAGEPDHGWGNNN